jgi:hypothetical protein
LPQSAESKQLAVTSGPASTENDQSERSPLGSLPIVSGHLIDPAGQLIHYLATDAPIGSETEDLEKGKWTRPVSIAAISIFLIVKYHQKSF